jgi:hypothetical protein
MSDPMCIDDHSFWKFLVSIEELKERKEVDTFCATLAIDETALDGYCKFLERFNVSVMKDAGFIYPLQEKCKIKMEFTLSEWLALQATLPKENLSYFQKLVQNKMQMAHMAYARFSLYKKPDDVVVEENTFEALKKKIDYDINCKKSMKITFLTNKECDIFPHRLVFLDGTLCVVGENIVDKTLVYFGVEDIADIETLEMNYGANLSQIEVSEFITHLRLINGKEERLVLKFYSQDQEDFLPPHHFLGNPFVTSSVEGDMIWAATIEICDDVFHWLYTMRDRVEILDPGHIRKEFSYYCEMRKSKAPIKKVS